MDSIKRICLWSGPRNISTALMYSFAQRKDTTVFDEPLYAFYLKNHPEAKSYHPGADVILQTMENDGTEVVKMMLDFSDSPVVFFKHMTHHLLDLDLSFTKGTINIVLTRDPLDMLPSFDKVIQNPSINDVGYKLHNQLVSYFLNQNIPFAVLDSKDVLLNPEEKLRKLCHFASIPFCDTMLNWEPQKRKEDGVWAKYWYDSVHKSTGFQEYKPKTTQFPKHLVPLLNECQPFYKNLLQYAL